MEIIHLVLIINLLMCFWRLIVTIRMRRLISGVWFLTTYFSACMLIYGSNTPIRHHAKFSDQIWIIQIDSIHSNLLFVLGFNILLALGEMLTFIFLSRTLPDIKNISINKFGVLRRTHMLYGIMLIVGGALYWIKMSGLGYTDYVEYKMSNWPAVFFLSSAPFITIGIILRKHFLSLCGVFIFVYFAISLNVRSFILISGVPAAIIIILLYIGPIRTSIWQSIKKIWLPVFLVILFIAFGTLLMYQRTGRIYLPETGLPIGMHIIMDRIRHGAATVDWNSFKVMLNGIAMPAIKLFSIDLGVKQDSPVYYASIFEGFVGNPGSYYHYPVLWYADAYASFREWGIIIGLFWGILLTTVERLIAQSVLIFSIFLPYYVWMAYFIVRGAIGNAFLSICYEVYLNLGILVLIVVVFRILSKQKVSTTLGTEMKKK